MEVSGLLEESHSEERSSTVRAPKHPVTSFLTDLYETEFLENRLNLLTGKRWKFTHALTAKGNSISSTLGVVSMGSEMLIPSGIGSPQAIRSSR